MTETSELIKQIEVVAESRRVKAALDRQIKDSRAMWEADNLKLLDSQKYQATTLEGCETRLRELTIEVYNQTGNKKPCQGVGIRELIKLAYDPLKALAWATEHKIALALDKRAFEGIAKQSPLDFVTSTTEIQATIATELKVEHAKTE